VAENAQNTRQDCTHEQMDFHSEANSAHTCTSSLQVGHERLSLNHNICD